MERRNHQTYSFRDVYEGNNKKIIGLQMANTSVYDPNIQNGHDSGCGLFAKVGNAGVIRNLTVKTTASGIKVSSKQCSAIGVSIVGLQCLGGIVGANQTGVTISECYAKNVIMAPEETNIFIMSLIQNTDQVLSVVIRVH